MHLSVCLQSFIQCRTLVASFQLHAFAARHCTREHCTRTHSSAVASVIRNEMHQTGIFVQGAHGLSRSRNELALISEYECVLSRRSHDDDDDEQAVYTPSSMVSNGDVMS